MEAKVNEAQVKNLNTFLHALTYGAKYTFLEDAQSNPDLAEVVAKKGIKLPSRDLSIFKCNYAFTDEMNRNGCTLPMAEVEPMLSSLVGKAIDLDHYRKRTVGVWLDAKLDGTAIVAYGAFWKANFAEEFTDIKNLMEQSRLKVSFEAWGDRIYKTPESYDLTNIEFAGGALLLTEDPAFPNAAVLELSSKTLELAKVMTPPTNFITERGTVVEKASKECPNCHTQSEDKVTKCSKCGKDLTNIKPMEDEEDEEEDSSKKACKGGTQMDELLKKYNKATVEELTKFLDETIANDTSKATELAELKKKVEELEASMKAKDELAVKTAEESKVASEKLAEEHKLAIAKATEDGKKIGERRVTLADYAKDLKDEDILDETKFELAKTKKELAEIKASKTTEPEKAAEGKDKIVVGSKDKTETKPTSFDLQKKVLKKAYHV